MNDQNQNAQDVQAAEFEIEYALNMSRQHVDTARYSIENGIDDLIGYSIRSAEKWLKKAEFHQELLNLF